MTHKKIGDMLIAIVLCIAMMCSIVTVAAGEEISTDPTEPASTESAQPTPTDPTESTDPTEPTEPTEPTDPTDPADPADPLEPEDKTMKVSDAMVDVLKQLEGFQPYAYWDYKQYTIGYGSKCPEGMETYYQSNPISKEYAEELLRKELDTFEAQVNGFIERNGLTLSQHQYDALVSFTYNVGGSWTNSSTSNLSSAIISGDTGSHVLYGLMLYSMAGNRHILIKRRVIEIDMYANGIYPENVNTGYEMPDRYRIAFMDGNGGAVKYDEHGFDTEQPIAVKTVFTSNPTGPDETGAIVTYVFDGWYTERIGGTKVDVLDASVPTGAVLYAHWKTPGGTPVVIPRQETGVKVTVTVTGNNVNVRANPDTYYASLYKAQQGETLEIVEVTTRGGLLWGRFGDCWISLQYTDYNEVISKLFPLTATVTATTLNVRTGAGTGYALVTNAQKKKGDLVQVTEWKSDGTMMWGKIAEGWIALPYVTFGDTTPDGEVTAQSIEITQGPNKLTYIQKVESLDLTGAKLSVTYSDGTVETVDITAEMVSGFDNSTVGVNTVTVSYEGMTATLEVQIIKAKIIFRLEDGTVISEKEYLYGDTVEIPAAPEKAGDNIYTYEFAGWGREVTACEGNAVYTATFNPVYIDYTVIFADEDGRELSKQTYHWGDKVNAPAEPTKAADNTYTYAFAGWDKEVVDCAGDATYTAAYSSVYIDYTVTFRYADGTVIEELTLHYGDAVTAPKNPAVPGELGANYVFDGWDNEITVCRGDAVYTAKFAARYPKGDIDGDFKVTSDDVIQLLLHVSMPDMFPIVAEADFTGDGKITSDDVIQLLLHVSMPDMFPL